MKKNWLWSVVVFLAAGWLTYISSYYPELNKGETVRCLLDLPLSAEQSRVIDLAQQGPVKYYIQPGAVLMQLNTNIASDAGDITVKLTDLQGTLSQSGKKGVWHELQANEPLQTRNVRKMPGRPWRDMTGKKDISVYVDLNIPRQQTRQYHVAEGWVEFNGSDEPKGRVKIQIVNSKYL